MKPIDEMKRILSDASVRPESCPELRAQTKALLCVADVLADFDARLRQIERRIWI